MMKNVFYFMFKIWNKNLDQTSPFYKKSKLSISGSTFWNIIQFVFIVGGSRGLRKYIKTKMLTTYLYKALLKNKKTSVISLPACTKYFSQYFLLIDNIFYILTQYILLFIVWLPLLLKMLGNMYIVLIYFRVCDVINFQINLSFLNKITKKSRQKYKYLKNKKSF